MSVGTILERTSVRRFENRSPGDAVLGRLGTIIAEESAPGPFGFTPRFRLVSADAMSPTERLGTYGVIRGAPAFVVGAALPTVGAWVDFAYRMEGIILGATAMGLGTCWLGGTFSRSAASSLLQLRDDEVIPAVTPLGFRGHRAHIVGDVVKLVARSSTRRAFEQLFFDGSFDNPLSADRAAEFGTVLECVRRAPSARNLQPWRIILERRASSDRLHLYLAGESVFDIDSRSRNMHHLDMGIAMRHVAESAAALGIVGRWSRATVPIRPAGGSSMAYVAAWAG